MSYTATPEDDGQEISVFFSGGFLPVGSDLDTCFDNAVFSHEVYVTTVEELAAAAAAAVPDDVINIAEGTYNITSQIAIKDGVTFRGAGSGLTIIDGHGRGHRRDTCQGRTLQFSCHVWPRRSGEDAV